MSSVLGPWSFVIISRACLHQGPRTRDQGPAVRCGCAPPGGTYNGMVHPSPSAAQPKEPAMADAYLLSAARTPIGKYLGGLSDLTAPQLGAAAVAEAMRRAKAPPERIDEVILGLVLQAGVGQAPARQAALAAGLPDTIAAVT